jgi:hypothetical protein
MVRGRHSTRSARQSTSSSSSDAVRVSSGGRNRLTRRTRSQRRVRGGPLRPKWVVIPSGARSAKSRDLHAPETATAAGRARRNSEGRRTAFTVLQTRPSYPRRPSVPSHLHSGHGATTGRMPTPKSCIWECGWRGTLYRIEQLEPESVLRALGSRPRSPRQSVAVRLASGQVPTPARPNVLLIEPLVA